MLAAAWLELAAGMVLGTEPGVSLAEDGTSLSLRATGVLELTAGFGAEIERNGQRVELHSASLATGATVSDTAEPTPFGQATIREVTVPMDGCELWFRLGEIPGVPGATLQAGVRNTGTSPLRLVRTLPMAMSDQTPPQRVALRTAMASTIHQPLGEVRDDLSANQQALRIMEETFAQGIGCHAPSELAFPLDGKFSRFQCLAGVDDAGSGSVTFEVHADGVKVFDSGLVLRGQPARVIDVDVSGKRELRLVITDGGDGTQFDWANWADAGLRRDPEAKSQSEARRGMRFEGRPADWIAGPMVGQNEASVAQPIERAFEPLTVREAGGFYHRDGRGLFFGAVGQPIAYLTGRMGSEGPNRAMLELESAMDSVEVAPGETRWGQQAVVLLEGPQAAQERWISWVAQSHAARPPRDAFSGWLSWYWLGPQVSEQEMQPLLDLAENPASRLRPAVIQIDDGYQRPDGRPGLNEKFPSGLEGMARKITHAGATPGLMIHAEESKSLDAIRDAVKAGYRYLKLNRTQMPAGRTRTAFEAKRARFAAIREAAGEDTYLLATEDGVDRACVGLVDAKRISGSTQRHEVATSIADSVRSLALNRRWFTADNDCYYLTADLPGLAPVAGGTPLVRTWLSLTGLACGNAMTSDPWHWPGMKPFLRNSEILTPPARETPRVIDLGTSPTPSRIVGQVERPWGKWTVALLWNPGPQAREIQLDFAAAGMDPRARYAVWSFWDQRFLGIAEKSWTTPALDPNASQHLCFTPLGDDPLKPELIGSNLHIWCGAAEFEQVTALHGAMEIRFTDAGARDGELFVRCGSRPEIRVAKGCNVASIESTGGEIWRVAITGRQRGAPQRVEFGIYQPVTRQPWFWLLMASVAASLAFAAWRYLENLRAQQEIVRLQQRNALEEERARIARDLHDELGANLARIGLLTELADQAIGEPDKARHQLDRILQATRGLTRQLDSVVWAVDPANDTLESLARYLHGHAEEYLGIAGIRCRFEADELPDVPLSSSLRHHLLMITKEVLHNVVKHAAASLVKLRLHMEQGRLILEIEDDGKGIGKPDGHRHGNGLQNIRKRAQAAGGHCEIGPSFGGKGTLVRLIIPLNHPIP